MLDMAKEIRKLLIDEGIGTTELAKRLNTSQGNLGNKLKRNNFSTKELEEIANVLGYDLRIEFIKKEIKMD